MQTKATLFFVCLCFVAESQTPQARQNIETFNRLFGYVRYFHPSDEAANLDWNRFAVYGSREIMQCKDDTALHQTLVRLFEPIAPSLKIIFKGEATTFSVRSITPPDTAGYKVVTWQHYGVASPEQKGIYASGRLNRKVVTPTSGFSTITASIDVQKYRGEEFRLTGDIRFVDGKGSGHLWARVDRVDKKLVFFDNMEDRPVTSDQWTPSEIKGTIDEDALSLVFGCFLKGQGKLVIDNLNLGILIDNEWTSVYSNSFEEDATEKFPSSISGTHGVPEYSTAVTDLEAADGEKSVVIESVAVEYPFKQLFGDYCKIGERVTKDIGSGLVAIMPLALYGREDHTWPRGDENKLSELLSRVQNISVDPVSDVSVRVGGIIMAWNVFQHFYPYFDVVGTNWPEAFRSAIKETYADQSVSDYLRTLQRLTAKLKDGHANVYHFGLGKEAGFAPPIAWEWIENKLVITNVKSADLKVKPGDIVTEIDGVTAGRYFEDVYAHISSATPGWLAYQAQIRSLLGQQNASLKIRIVDENDATREVTLSRTLNGAEYWSFNKSRRELIKALSPDVYYINISDASMEQIRAELPRLKKAKAIICDMRGYPNRNHQFISHLLHENDTSTQWMRIPRIIYPDQENVAGWEKMGWSLKPDKTHLDAKVFFLLDGRAISYAESYMSFIEHYDLATIVGQPSAGTNGNVNRFTLPGDYTISWTGMKVFKHDGSQLHGVGITPDVYVKRTIKGVRENRDEFLEKALELAAQAQFRKKQ